MEVHALDDVIICIVSVCHKDSSVLLDPGSTYSYVLSYFTPYLDMPHDFLDILIHMSILVGDSIMMDCVYWSCVVAIGGYEIMVDLLLLNIVNFEVILGMDQLSLYHTIINYHA